MSDTIEIRFHGRGGQGTVTLAALAVDAIVRGGRHALGFPAFGTERTGAPVEAFVRCAVGPIRDRSEVRRPHVVVVQDVTLFDGADVLAGLRPGGLVVVNGSALPPLPEGARGIARFATPIAQRHLGAPITSTAMLALTAAATGLASVDDVCAAIRDRFAGDLAARNEAVARDVFAGAGDEAAA